MSSSLFHSFQNPKMKLPEKFIIKQQPRKKIIFFLLVSGTIEFLVKTHTHKFDRQNDKNDDDYHWPGQWRV